MISLGGGRSPWHESRCTLVSRMAYARKEGESEPPGESWPIHSLAHYPSMCASTAGTSPAPSPAAGPMPRPLPLAPAHPSHHL